jgi:hypothetical protein
MVNQLKENLPFWIRKSTNFDPKLYLGILVNI